MCWCGAKSADVVFCESDLCTMAREKAFQQELTIPPRGELPADVRASLEEAEKGFASEHGSAFLAHPTLRGHRLVRGCGLPAGHSGQHTTLDALAGGPALQEHNSAQINKVSASPAATAVQAKPQGKGPAILPLVVADLEARAHLGRQKYGEVLRAANGRDALTDAYQEALDLAMYLRQAIEERRLAKASASPSPISPISTMPPSIATPLDWWCQNCNGFRPAKYHRADMVCGYGHILASFKVNDCIPNLRIQAPEADGRGA